MVVVVHGYAAPGFEGVREQFRRNFEAGWEKGSGFCAYRHGEVVVDLWAGSADKKETAPWRQDTLANMQSVTKGMVALCVAMLVDRGLLDYEVPVAEYWPEFAAKGKGSITVKQLLSHKAGVFFPTTMRQEAIFNWEESCSALAAAEPLWEPGTRAGYHAIAFGHLAGELVRRVSGRSVGTFFAEEVARPLGADIYIGVPESEMHRVARMIAPQDSAIQFAAKDIPADMELVTKAFWPVIGISMNTKEWRAAEIPGANGTGTAAGIARVYGAMALGGTLGGVRLLSAGGMAQATIKEFEGADLVNGEGIAWGRGFLLNSRKGPMIYGPNETAFGHPGAGGSLGMADPQLGVGVGYVMNQMGSNPAVDHRVLLLLEALYDALGSPVRYRRDRKSGLPQLSLSVESVAAGNLRTSKL